MHISTCPAAIVEVSTEVVLSLLVLSNFDKRMIDLPADSIKRLKTETEREYK